jgi:hypothetical protein
LQVVASEIDLQTVPDTRQTARFNTDDVEALQESADQRVSRAVLLVNADVLTIDEARAEVNLEPLPGGAGTLTQTPYRQRANAPLIPTRNGHVPALPIGSTT